MKKALVVGLKRSGIASCKFLIYLGYIVYAYDDDIINCDSKLIENIGVSICNSEIDITMFEIVVISPSIPIRHWLINKCKLHNIGVISELELAARYCLGQIAAITGTNGKTTTCSLLHHITSKWRKSWLVGNVGDAITNHICEINEQDIVVTEVSSFQLEGVSTFKPKIAAILNITEDHLDRHITMDNYILTKYKITSFQDKDDYIVLNADDVNCVAAQCNSDVQKYYFSTERKVFGAYVFDNHFYFLDEKIACLSNFKLIGKHNISNALCVIVCAKLLNVPNEIIADGLATFEAVPHRMQTVAAHNNITYINDSKATNIDSTIVAVNSISSPTVLIVGGSEKGYQFDKLIINLTEQIVGLVIIGQTSRLIVDACIRNNYLKYYLASSLSHAVILGEQLLINGGILLLSPACASFDMFNDYIDRGQKFIDLVRNIDIEE